MSDRTTAPRDPQREPPDRDPRDEVGWRIHDFQERHERQLAQAAETPPGEEVGRRLHEFRDRYGPRFRPDLPANVGAFADTEEPDPLVGTRRRPRPYPRRDEPAEPVVQVQAAPPGDLPTPDAPPDDGRRRGGRRRGGGERLMVPEAEFRSYYGRPIVKAPIWHDDIAWYLFTGGLAAGSSLLAAGADLTGRPVLRRSGRLTSLAALGASTWFLVHDLGRPARFHHMLRVAKITSPMSVGTWILATFGPAAGLAAIAEAAPLLPSRGVFGLVRRALPVTGRVAGLAAAVTAPALATYTGVLLADTATPSWHEAYRELPFVFAGSALAASAGAGLIAAPLAEAGPARRAAVTGAALELVAIHRVEHGHGLLSEPFHQGRSRQLLRAARLLNVAGAAGAVLGRRSRVASALSGAALLAASMATRFGIFTGGVASAKDPKYTVLPQRERLARAAVDSPAVDSPAVDSPAVDSRAVDSPAVGSPSVGGGVAG